MERLTKPRENASYYVEEAVLRHEPHGYSGEAVDRLAIFENVYEHLLENQAEIVKELESAETGR